MEEQTEGLELSEKDQADIIQLFGEPSAEDPHEPAPEPPSYHTILEVWREALRPAAELAHEKVTPQYASKMVASYAGLSYAQVQQLHDRYFAKIEALAQVLLAEIDSDPDALSHLSPEEDALENAAHYKNILRDWQLTLLDWELAWTTTDQDAVVELAAISEVHKMFFGPVGMTAYLDNIRFEFTEADQEALAAALEEHRLAGVNGE